MKFKSNINSTKYYIMLVLLFCLTIVKAQTNTFPTTGNVGLGTLSPSAGLDIVKSFVSNQQKAMRLFYNGTWGSAEWASEYRFIDVSSAESGSIFQLNGSGLGIGFNPPNFQSPDKLYINGNVGIGTNMPTEKLSVKGNIRAQEIKVESANWPDYVFTKDYRLTPLPEIEKSIAQLGHLPDMPSAKSVSEKGISLGEMNGKLLLKIEELTLHLIEQHKKLVELEQKYALLAKESKR